MAKLDLTKSDKNYYTASRRPELKNIEAAQYVSITGQGDPNSPLYAEKVQALFSVGYALKFACKAKNLDFVVPKLEGLWWFDVAKYENVTLENAPLVIPRNEWQWRIMIRMPDFVKEENLTAAIGEVTRSKGIARVTEVTWYTSSLQKVAQILHVGPFDREPETLQILQEFINRHNFKKAGNHHEIYLSDIRRAAPEKWRTILREPVQ